MHLKNKKLIFCFTTGRSGTGLLAQLLQTLPRDKVFATHEEKPLFDDYLTDARDNPELFYRYWYKKKLPIIKSLPQPIYIETSHVINKGFIDSLLSFNLDVSFIYLYRDIEKVAASMHSLDDIPGRTKTGCRYYLLPWENQLKIRDGGEDLTLTDYQLCYWYCKEIQHRAGNLQKQLGDRFYPIQLEELKLTGYFQEMLYALGLPYPTQSGWDDYALLRHTVVNQKLGRKVRPLPMDVASQREEVDKLCIG